MREEVRSCIKSSTINTKEITREQVRKLRILLDEHLIRYSINNPAMWLTPSMCDYKYITIDSDEFEHREAVAFHRCGFVGIAGWADDNQVKPIIDALAEWCEYNK